jgi:hypothetical protein
VWASTERIDVGIDAAGHLTIAPELVVEILSAGEVNEHRDRFSISVLSASRNLQTSKVRSNISLLS